MGGHEELANKITTLGDAVRRFIPNGTQLALGGFTVSRNPMALVHEIVRQGVRDLHLVCHSNGQALDLLIGAGCVKRVEIAYAGNGRYAPTCVRFRRAVESGTLECEDYSNLQMTLRFLAGSLGLPFIPSPSGAGTDLLLKEGFSPETRSDPKVASRKWAALEDPFAPSPRETFVLPALRPDVTMLHVQEVGDDGTIRIKGLKFVDVESARAATRLVVTCERIVPADSLRADPDSNAIPGFLVDAVIPVPFGAHPTSCLGEYDVDPQHLALYRKCATDDERFRHYLDTFILGVTDHDAYLDRIGRPHLESLRADPHYGYARGLDRK